MEEIAETIRVRGMHFKIATNTKALLDRLHAEQHGALSLEWMRVAPPTVVSGWLRNVRGLGRKSTARGTLSPCSRLSLPADLTMPYARGR